MLDPIILIPTINSCCFIISNAPMYISDAIILNFLMLELIQLASRLTRSTRKWHRGSYKLLGVASHLERYIFNEMGREGKKSLDS